MKNSLIKYSTLLLCFGLIIIGCKKSGNSALVPYGSVFEKIMKTDSGIFRGVSIGMPIEEIKSREGKKAEEEEVNDGVNYLVYNNVVDSSSNYSVTYLCPGGKVNEINADIYLVSEEEGVIVFESFKKYFQDTYGKYETDGDFYLWTVPIANSKAQIAIADESATYKKGKITLIINESSEK